MKKVILVIVILAMFLTLFSGCGKKDRTIGEKPVLNLDTTEDPAAKNTKEPVATNTVAEGKNTQAPAPDIEILNNSGTMRIIMARDQWNDFTDEDEQNWEDYILDKYNFSIDIVSITKDYNTSMSVFIKKIEAEAEEGGFIYTTDLPMLNALIDSGLIEPVNDYIGKVERYNVLPDGVVQQLSDISGNMWGFPLNDTIYTRTPDRIYSNSWLQAANMTVPKTIEEFYEFAMFVSKTDLDGNGEYDSYVAEYTDYGWMYDLEDILRAYGCYAYGQSTIAYNPRKSMYENFVFNENFIEAITFIKLLNDEGVLFDRRPGSENYTDEKKLESYQIAATTRLDIENIIEGGISMGNFLTGVNTEYICQNRLSGSCLAVIKGTPEPAESIKGLINLLSSNPNSRMDFVYGIEDVHYEEEADYFNITTKNALGNYSMKRMNIIIWLSDMGFSEKYIIRDGIDYRQENAEYLEMMTAAREELEEVDDAYTYSIPLECHDSRLDTLRDKTYGPTRDLFRNIIINNMQIEEAIEKYRQRLSGLKVFDTIDAMNLDLK